MTDDIKWEPKGYVVNAEAPAPDWARYVSAARTFLDSCDIDPNHEDALGQLVQAFLPALRVIASRGYDPRGGTWRDFAWRGCVLDIKKKAERLWYRAWVRGGKDNDSALDIINFGGFYLRSMDGPEWGNWGKPGSPGDISPAELAEAARNLAETTSLLDSVASELDESRREAASLRRQLRAKTEVATQLTERLFNLEVEKVQAEPLPADNFMTIAEAKRRGLIEEVSYAGYQGGYMPADPLGNPQPGRPGVTRPLTDAEAEAVQLNKRGANDYVPAESPEQSAERPAEGREG